MLFDYPKNAAFGRILPKSKIFEHSRPSVAIKELFTRQVKQIVWEFKLAPETINLPRTANVPELQVLSITLKESEIRHEVLQCIDKSIPFPLLFELHFEGQIKVIAAYKRPSDLESSKFVLSDYFETPWMSSYTSRKTLPIVLNLEELYVHMINPLLPFPAYQYEGLATCIEKMAQVMVKQREIEKGKEKLRKEKQFNRKVEINAELRVLIQELENLTRLPAEVIL